MVQTKSSVFHTYTQALAYESNWDIEMPLYGIYAISLIVCAWPGTNIFKDALRSMETHVYKWDMNRSQRAAIHADTQLKRNPYFHRILSESLHQVIYSHFVTEDWSEGECIPTLYIPQHVCYILPQWSKMWHHVYQPKQDSGMYVLGHGAYPGWGEMQNWEEESIPFDYKISVNQLNKALSHTLICRTIS